MRQATAVNYELGVRTNELGLIVPYARYIGLDTNGGPVEVKVDGTVSNEVHGGNLATVAIPAEGWSHLAATYDPDVHKLSLYINGELASYRTDADEPWGFGIKEGSNYKSELTVGGGRKTGSLVERGFAGYLDEVTILGGALSADRVRKDAQSATALWATLHGPGASQTVRQDPINQAMSQEHSVNQILIRFKSTISASDTTNLISSYGTARVESYRIAPIHLIQITDGMTVSQKLVQIRNDSRVLYAEPNYMVSIDRTPNDPGYRQLWGMHNSSGGGDISAPEAWSRAIGSRDVIVAVIDTGIDYNHVDLKENMWVNTGEIPTQWRR